MSAKASFRADINGLRAWAVVAVVLYHFGVSGFSSGFVGVDIFFVISGYLMTGIIVRGLEDRDRGLHGFSILGFYFARARRIIPALAALCAVLLILGWKFLETGLFGSLGGEVAAALTFLSNYKYWLNPEPAGGYFAYMSIPRWLLHSWSLSVEWQFYILLPLLLAAVWKLKPGRAFLATFLLVIAAASFAVCIAATYISAEFAFYSLPTRAWEMLAGGLVYLWPASKSAPGQWTRPLELGGLALVLLSVFLPQPQMEWPGYRAMMPVLGTVLVLLANRQDSILTNTPAAQFLGKISYSTYLWHWPVVVAFDYFGLIHQAAWIAGGMVLTLGLSWLSYTLVEDPARKWTGRLDWPKLLAALAAVTIIPTGAGALAWARPDSDGRLSPRTEQIISQQMNFTPRRNECHRTGEIPGPMCHYGEGKLGAVVLGDSHGIGVVAAVQSALPRDDVYVLNMTTAGCPTVRGVESVWAFRRCPEFMDWALDEVARLDPGVPVIMVSRWSYYLFGSDKDGTEHSDHVIRFVDAPGLGTDEMRERFRTEQVRAFCEVSAHHPTYALLPVPEMNAKVPQLAGMLNALGLENTVSIRQNAYERRHAASLEILEQAAEECGVTLLDPVHYLCSGGKCWGTKEGIPLYFDAHHLTAAGAEQLTPLFRTIW